MDADKEKMAEKFGDVDTLLSGSDVKPPATRLKKKRNSPALDALNNDRTRIRGIDNLKQKNEELELALKDNERAVESLKKKLTNEKEGREQDKQKWLEDMVSLKASVKTPGKSVVITMPVTKQKVSFELKGIDSALIDVSPENERIQSFLDEISLSDILPSIKRDGQQKPGTVRPKADGRYELIEGSRRLAAVKIAEMEYLAFVGDVPDADVRLLSEIENNHKDVSPYEKALSFVTQINQGVYEHWNQLGAAKGISESHIHRYKACTDIEEIYVSILPSPSDMPLSYGETIKSLLKKNSETLKAKANELLKERNALLEAGKSKQERDVDEIIKELRRSVRLKQDKPKAKKPLLYLSVSGEITLKHSVTSKGDAKFEVAGAADEQLDEIVQYLKRVLGVAKTK